MRNGLALLLAIAGLSAAQAAERPHRFVPSDPDYVVIANVAPTSAAVQPNDAPTAAKLAELYLVLARSTRDARYFGRAEAALRPWVSQGIAHSHILLLQADILQNRHDFKGAGDLLDQVIAMDSGDSRARLMRATLLMVRGEAAKARGDCAALMGLGQTSVSAICLAQSIASSGQLQRGAEMVKLTLARNEASDPATRAWAHAVLADLEGRRGNLQAAESNLRIALRATPQDESIRSILADILIARGSAAEAMRLSDLPQASVGLLVRRLLAQIASAAPESEETSARLGELLRLEMERDERVHLREETLLALGTTRPALQTLKLARENFSVQREAIDIRLLARAARNADDQQVLDELREWCTRTGFQDRLVEKLLSDSEARKS